MAAGALCWLQTGGPRPAGSSSEDLQWAWALTSCRCSGLCALERASIGAHTMKRRDKAGRPFVPLARSHCPRKGDQKRRPCSS